MAAIAVCLAVVACSRQPARRAETAKSESVAVNRNSLPDPGLTPGRISRATREDVCRSGYSKRTRAVSSSVKRRVYKAYGRSLETGVCCEVDHLIPLALGGSNSPQNLWPQPYTGKWTAAEKDQLENKLHRLVCSGKLDLTVAQQAISSDWVEAYKEYVAR